LEFSLLLPPQDAPPHAEQPPKGSLPQVRSYRKKACRADIELQAVVSKSVFVSFSLPFFFFYNL
jgi:hypothetical protein